MRISWSRSWLLALLVALAPPAWAQRPRPTPPTRPTETPTEAPTATPDEGSADERDDGERSREGAAAREDESRDDERRERRRRRRGEEVAFGGSVKVARGEVNRDDIFVMGGKAEIEGEQKGDVVVLGGRARISGEVDGDVVVVGGPLKIENTARIHGDAVSVGGRVDKEEGATVSGDTVSAAGFGMPHEIFSDLPWRFGWGGVLLMSFVKWLQKAVLALALTVLIAAVLPARVEAAAGVLRTRPLPCFGWGLLTFAVAWTLAFLLVLTCIGCILAVIPVGFYYGAQYFGMAALFLVVGQSLARTGFGRELTLLPALLLGFLALSILGLVLPLAWWIYGFLGVGCAILTRFGTMRPWFPPATPTVPPPAPTTPTLSDGVA